MSVAFPSKLGLPVAAILFACFLCWHQSDSFCLAASLENAQVTVPTLKEIRTMRQSAREALMLPSLVGIRGLAYGIVGVKDADPLEKQMSSKLSDLGIPIVRLADLADGAKPIDAIVEIRVKRTDTDTILDLIVTEWVSLLRSPKTQVRAVTYRNQMIVPGTKCDAAISELSNQFVVDYLTANHQKGSKQSINIQEPTAVAPSDNTKQ